MIYGCTLAWLNISCNLFVPCNKVDLSRALVSPQGDPLPIGRLTFSFQSGRLRGLILFAVAEMKYAAIDYLFDRQEFPHSVTIRLCFQTYFNQLSTSVCV